jgi:ubiquinone/menaquinone biosynthesis C-methylase UbiE
MDTAEAPFEAETLTACPLCGSTDLAPWASAPDVWMRRAEHVFRYARCRACDLLFQQERPTEATAGYFYEGNYGPYLRGKKKKNPARAFRKLATRIGERLSGEKAVARAVDERRSAQLTKPGASVLDFGCGGGRFLDACKERFGVRTVGMDFNPSLFERLRQRGHEAFEASAEGWSHIGDNGFDLVVMNHVLEHVYHPRAVLAEVHRAMKPDGLLDIAVPNPDGYSARAYGADWFSLDSPRHVMLFTPQVAEKLLREMKFTDIEIVGEPVIRDAVRSKARADRIEFTPASEADVWLPIEIAQTVRREAAGGAFDRFHIFARKG